MIRTQNENQDDDFNEYDVIMTVKAVPEISPSWSYEN